MSDIVRVSVNSTVKTVDVAVNQTTKVVMVDVQTSVASLVVQRRTVADGSPVDGVTTADYLGQQCIVGNANGPFTVYTASQVSPSRWTTVTPASLGLLIGTNVLAYRTFGTAANNNSGDFAPATGSSSILTLGTVTTGTWGASVIAGQYGGTGIANTGKSITLGGNFLTSSAIQFNCTGSLAFVGPTTGCTFTLPSSSAVLARTDAAQTFAGVQTFASISANAGSGVSGAFLGSANIATFGDMASVGLAAQYNSTGVQINFGNYNGDTRTAGNLYASNLTATRNWTLPDASGTVALTSNITEATAVGTLTVGTWNATVIAGQYGGTGVSNTGKTITLGGNLSTSSQIAFSCSGSLAFVGPTTGCTFTLPSSSAWLARTDAAQTFAGVQTFSSVPVFSALTRTSVYLASAQTMIVSTYDTVKFDTVEFGSGFNTGTNSYTVPYTGYLKVTGAIGVQSGATGGYFVVTVYRNGTQVKRCFSNVGYMFGSISPISVIIPVTAADAITIRVYSSPAATLFANSTDTWCQFEMLPN